MIVREREKCSMVKLTQGSRKTEIEPTLRFCHSGVFFVRKKYIYRDIEPYPQYTKLKGCT